MRWWRRKGRCPYQNRLSYRDSSFSLIQSPVPTTVGSFGQWRIDGRSSGRALSESGAAANTATEAAKNTARKIEQAWIYFHAASLVPCSARAAPDAGGCWAARGAWSGRRGENRGLFFGADVIGLTRYAATGKDGRFKMGGHRDVCGEVIVYIGVQMSGIDMGRAEAGDA